MEGQKDQRKPLWDVTSKKVVDGHPRTTSNKPIQTPRGCDIHGHLRHGYPLANKEDLSGNLER
jgi:hypothetical protein